MYHNEPNGLLRRVPRPSNPFGSIPLGVGRCARVTPPDTNKVSPWKGLCLENQRRSGAELLRGNALDGGRSVVAWHAVSCYTGGVLELLRLRQELRLLERATTCKMSSHYKCIFSPLKSCHLLKLEGWPMSWGPCP